MKDIDSLWLIEGILLIVAIFVVFALVSTSAEAQSVRCGVDIEGHVLTGQSLIDRVGGQMDYNYSRTETHPDGDPWTTDIYVRYGFNEQDFELERDRQTFLRGGVTCVLSSGLQLALRVSDLSTGGDFSTVVRSDTTVFRFLKSWDGQTNMPPLINTENEGWTSDIPFDARDQFGLTTVDLTAQQDLIEYDDGAVGGYAGIRYADASYLSQMDVSQHVYFNVKVEWYLNGEWWFGYIQEFENFVTLDTDGWLESTLLGPSYGATLRQDIGPLSLNASVGQARLRESNERTGLFRDVDDIEQTVDYLREDGSVYATRHQTVYLDGSAYYQEDGTRWVTVDDLRLSVDLDIGPFTVGGGLQHQTWNDLTLSPMLVDPWGLGTNSKAPTGLNWVSRTEDVELTSWFARTQVPLTF